MSALTFNEASKAAADSGNMREAAIYKLFAEKSDVVNAIRVSGMTGNSITYSQEGELSTVATRGVGESFVDNVGTLNNQTDALKIIGGTFSVDRFEYVTLGPEVRERQEVMKVKALSIGLTNLIMSGSEVTNPSDFDGLQTRIVESTQKIANGNSSGGDALSLKNLDKVIAYCEGCTHLIVSPLLQLKFQAAARSSTFPNVVMDKDDLGNQIVRYGNLPMLTGYALGSKNTMILPFAEANPGGGSAVGTSIYAVNLSEEGVTLKSNGGLSVRDLGEQNDAPQLKTILEMYVTMVDYSPYARSRLWGIKDADIVA